MNILNFFKFLAHAGIRTRDPRFVVVDLIPRPRRPSSSSFPFLFLQPHKITIPQMGIPWFHIPRPSRIIPYTLCYGCLHFNCDCLIHSIVPCLPRASQTSLFFYLLTLLSLPNILNLPWYFITLRFHRPCILSVHSFGIIVRNTY